MMKLTSLLPDRFRGVSLVLVLAVTVLAAGCERSWKPANPPVETFAPAKLRGYGTVSGEMFREPEGTVLSITCESGEKARLLQAKYLSDLQVLPGVTEVRGKAFTRYDAEGQGSIGAWQEGEKVTILAAKSADGFSSLARRVAPLGASVAQTQVPMFLDRWDKYGWRFYHRLWTAPAGVAPAKHDRRKDFDDLKALDRSGLVFGIYPHALNDASGMRDEAPWLWLAKAAEARGLPLGLNIATEVYGFPNWLTGRYPDEVQQKMPQFSGNIYRFNDGYLGARGTPSWAGGAMYDAAFGVMQEGIRKFRDLPNVVSFLEPHGELNHGAQDLFLEYGPYADRSFRQYLKEHAGSPAALSRRWFGEEGKIREWDEVRVPELASFLGWNGQAVDLRGEWAVGWEEFEDPAFVLTADKSAELYWKNIPTKPAPAEWFSENFDDSAWPRLTAPGGDYAFFVEKRPAVFRRTVELDGAWLADHDRLWLYVMDLNGAAGGKVQTFVNGRKVGEDSTRHAVPHWGAYEVTGLARPGKNQISLRLPKGFLAYRVYLSPSEPLHYPGLGEGRNAQWTDFLGWMSWTRANQVRRGMQAIRQVEPDRPITMMSPDFYANDVKTAAKEYGGEFHNTGYMAAFYADSLPGFMQGAGLPFSTEPGGPAKDLPEFRRFLGLWLMENVQGVDYFINDGDVLWNPEIRKNFEENLNLYHLFGKYHAPKAGVAALFSNQSKMLTGFPWGDDANAVMASGPSFWNITAPLRSYFDYDLLSESSFALGDAAKYRILIDANTSIMSEALAADLEKWVRDGGILITSGQTGRHTPEKFNSWPVSRLSGYEVVRLDRFGPDGKPLEERRLSVAAGESVFSGSWNGVASNGLGLRKAAPECRDLLRWDDGTTAVGIRPLGKGFVMQVGTWFGKSKLPDRVELDLDSQQLARLRGLYSEVLDYFKVPRVPVSTPDRMVFSRRFLSNNGLFDIWMVWNENEKPVTARLDFTSDVTADSAREIASGKVRPIANGSLRDIALEGFQAGGFLSPRHRIEEAPAAWFALQRNWWQGTKPLPADLKFPTVDSLQKNTVDLSDGWDFRPLNSEEDAAALAVSGTVDSSWKRWPLTVWADAFPGVKRAVFRKTFRIPESWTGGETRLWIQGWNRPTFNGRADVWLDGKLIAKENVQGVSGPVFDSFTPGSEHTLAMAVEGDVALPGLRGGAWLAHRPAPLSSLDLAGEWQISQDALRYSPTRLPGDWNGRLARRTVTVGDEYSGKDVWVHYSGSADLTGVIINGRWVRQDHHQISKDWLINITPWVKFGQENEIQIGRLDNSGQGTVDTLRLDFYDKNSYP